MPNNISKALHIFIRFHPLSSTCIHIHTFAMQSLHPLSSRVSLPWSFWDPHKMVLNTQTYKWDEWDLWSLLLSTDLQCYSNPIGGFSVQANKYSPKPQLWVFWNQLKEIDLQQQCMCELAQLLINHNTLLLPRFCSKMLKSEEEECIQRCLPIFRHFSPISSSRFLTTKWETESPGHLSVNICWALKKIKNTCIAICSP